MIVKPILTLENAHPNSKSFKESLTDPLSSFLGLTMIKVNQCKSKSKSLGISRLTYINEFLSFFLMSSLFAYDLLTDRFF